MQPQQPDTISRVESDRQSKPTGSPARRSGASLDIGTRLPLLSKLKALAETSRRPREPGLSERVWSPTAKLQRLEARGRARKVRTNTKLYTPPLSARPAVGCAKPTQINIASALWFHCTAARSPRKPLRCSPARWKLFSYFRQGIPVRRGSPEVWLAPSA